MVNTANMVADLLGGLMNPNASNRLNSALGAQGLGSPNDPLSAIFSQLQGGLGSAQTSGGTQGSGGSGAGGLLGIAMNLLGGMKQNPGLAGGAGALAGMFLGGGKGAMRGGALALLGSLAASALTKSGRQSAPQSRDTLPGSMRAFNADPLEDAELSSRADLMLEAMVNAAKADGRLDEDEIARIQGKLSEDGLEQSEVDAFRRFASTPLDLDGFAAKIRDEQTAAEVYAASVLAISVDTDAERRYLALLAERMGLDAQTVSQLNRMLLVNT